MPISDDQDTDDVDQDNLHHEGDTSAPSLKDIEREYIIHILMITPSRAAATRVLGISYRTLTNKILQFKIAPPVRRQVSTTTLPTKTGVRNTGAIPRVIANKSTIQDVSHSVTPEERDYYYNLDFLCGVYQKVKMHGLDNEE